VDNYEKIKLHKQQSKFAREGLAQRMADIAEQKLKIAEQTKLETLRKLELKAISEKYTNISLAI
jgi:hypothetical protein